MSSTGNIFRHGALFSLRTSRLFISLLSSVPAVLLTVVFLLSSIVPADACTPKIVWQADGNQPDFVEAGSSVTFSWKVENVSSCDAIDYHLGFDESVPASSSADYGGENHPTFTLLAGQTDFVEAKMVSAPSNPDEIGKTFTVYYDIFKPDGTSLIDLPLGGLNAKFTVIVPPTTLIYPENKETIDTETPTLEWKGQQGTELL